MVGVDDSEEIGEASSGDVTPETDLLGRYERMVQTQVETVNEIDDKAATTMRVVAVLLGALLSLLTFLSDGGTLDITATTIASVLWVAVGVAGLLVSLGLCLYTYLSSRTLFGPDSALGKVLASNRVTLDDYQSHLLGGYATAISANREVIRTNSRRFRNTLLMMLYGLVGISTGLALYIVDLSVTVDIAVSFAVFASTVVCSVYILQERYMVLPHEE